MRGRGERLDGDEMSRNRLTFTNSNDHPIYLYVEPWPLAFELEPKEKIEIIYYYKDDEPIEMVSHGTKEISIYLNFDLSMQDVEGVEFLEIFIDGLPAHDRDWNFKHRKMGD